jgi:hypothetical protein
MVLTQHGEIGLARRFACWVRDHDFGGHFDVFRVDFAVVGLDELGPPQPPEELDDLINELRTLV